MREEDLQTPAYVCLEDSLKNNLKILKEIEKRSGAKVLCALKGFAFSPAMKLTSEILSGATCSGLYEAKYATKHRFKEIHTYSPAFKDDEINEILDLSSHIVFNSFSQLNKFKKLALNSGKSIGLRVNPSISFAPSDTYDPCSVHSRLGIIKQNFDFKNFHGVDGLHFHALCEESAKSLEMVLESFIKQFSSVFSRLKWVNFGGGHLITKKGYDIQLLVDLIKNFKETYDLEIFLEPGEAVGWECGYLISSVLDIVENGEKICIIDASAECHMPDTILMPYRPKMRGESLEGKFSYLFGGATCLAGDIVGEASGDPIYKLNKELKIGDKVIFEDQIHYTVVKNTTFNGIKLPSLALVDKNGKVKEIKNFGFKEYESRN